MGVGRRGTTKVDSYDLRAYDEDVCAEFLLHDVLGHTEHHSTTETTLLVQNDASHRHLEVEHLHELGVNA